MSKRDIQVSLQTQTSGRVPHVGTGAVRGPTWVEQMGEALSYDFIFEVLSRPQLLNRISAAACQSGIAEASSDTTSPRTQPLIRVF